GALLLALLPSFPAVAAILFSLPGARLLRYPERLLLVVTLATALLAALGWERLRQRRGESRLRRIGLGLAASCAGVAALLVVRPASLDPVLARLLRLPPTLVPAGMMGPIRAGALEASLRAAAEMGLFAAALILLLRGSDRAGRAVAWGVPLGAAVSLLSAAAPARAMAPRVLLEAPSPLRDAVDRGAGALRLHHDPRPPGLGVWGSTDEQVWGYRFDRFTYALLTGYADGVPTILDAATDRMDLARPVALGARLAGLSRADQVRILRLAAVGSLL